MDNLQTPSLDCKEPISQDRSMNAVSTVGQDLHQARKSAWKHGTENKKCTLIVVYSRSMNYGDKDESQCIDNYVPFDALDLFAAVKTTHTGYLGTFDALSINDSKARFRVAVVFYAYLPSKQTVKFYEGSIAAPCPKLLIDKIPFRKVVRQQAPLAPSTRKVAKGIDDFAEGSPWRSSASVLFLSEEKWGY